MKSILVFCIAVLIATCPVAWSRAGTLASGSQAAAVEIGPTSEPAQLMGGRFLTLNTIVRVHQIEVTRDIAHGPDESLIRGHYPELFESSPAPATPVDNSTENWMHWRGPTADGRAGAKAKPPIRWGKDTNIAWVAELPGEGSATPLVVGNQIFVLSAIKTDRKSPNTVVNDERAKTVPDEMFYQFVVSSIDRHTGENLWQKVAIEEVPHEGKHETNTYAAGSPVTDGQRLYFSFGSRGVFCYSLSGDLIWKVDLGDMRTRNGWGEAVTPALTDESLIVNWDQEEGSFIVALDKQTGDVRWKVDRPGEVTSWNTPLITTFDGQQQVVVNGTGSVKSYAASDGTLLWECGGQTVNAIPSPLRFRESVICMSGYRGSLAVMIPLNSRGNVTESANLGWKVTEGTPYVPSPIVSGARLLFTAGNTNVLSCLDANTGEPLLEKMRLTGLRSMYASPIWANGHFYFTSREGATVVVKDNENLDIVSVNEIDDVVDASPVAVDDQLFLRSWSKLYCIENSPVEESPAKETAKNVPQRVPLSFRQVDLEDTAETSANASVGDLNGDGHLDIVLAKGRHWPLHNRVFLNDGHGSFPIGKAFAEEPDRTYSTALADVDLDADLDIIVSNDKPDEKVVFRNDGQGNFELTGTWGEPTWNTRNVTVVDMNGDRYPDLVVANRKSRSYIILNDGQGNFDRDHWHPIPSESATTIVAGDFNGDGFVDLVVPHRDGGVSRVLFSDGQLNFSSSTTFGPPTSATRACATGDLNGDGCWDLIMGDDRLGLMVCLNDGRGNFPAMLEVGDRALAPYAIAVGDMNQDQNLDLIVGYASGGSRVFLNDGKGTVYEEKSLGDGKGAVYGIATGDLNSDGNNDIVQARSEGTNAIFLNLGSSQTSE